MTLEMEKIQDELKIQRRLLEEINLAVSGSSKLGITGHGKRLELLENWKDRMNLKVAYTAGIVAGITFGGLEGIKALIAGVAKHIPMFMVIGITVSASAETNIYTATINSTSNTRRSCNGRTYWSKGLANFVPPSSQGGWYWPDTNVMTVSFTNQDARIEYTSGFGQIGCGTNSITFTNIFYPNDAYRFTVYSNTNHPVTGVIGLTTVGFTNAP